MTTYTAYFRTDAEFATREIKATTPEQALRKARRLYADDPFGLMFESYHGGMPVNEIVIEDADHEELAVWHDDDLRLRLAASDLLDALEQAVQALNCTPRFPVPQLLSDSYKIAAVCDRAIAKAKGGAA
jgi:hypothetical protein